MTTPELSQVVVRLVELLRQMGHADKADWLGRRLALVSDLTAGTDAVASAKRDLHGVVVGMGGILDLQPKVDPESQASRAAKEEADVLADRLYELTK